MPKNELFNFSNLFTHLVIRLAIFTAVVMAEFGTIINYDAQLPLRRTPAVLAAL